MESCNGRIRDELLDRNLLLSLPDARLVLDQWLPPARSFPGWTMRPPGYSQRGDLHQGWRRSACPSTNSRSLAAGRNFLMAASRRNAADLLGCDSQ
jgi:hypothetical protein